ncbi:MAG: cytochrome c-type biogenesis protein CcmH [Acidobacteriota bacterium]|nr:MAG: cytochrome c-type biogenesis protein CcmH [Acidobacteriota bacterium]
MYQIINLVAVLVVGIVIGIIVVQKYHGQPEEEVLDEVITSPADPTATQPLTTDSTIQVTPKVTPPAEPLPPVKLSQRSKVLATEFRCPCRCGHMLIECNCAKVPGQRDAKALLQALVDQEKPSDEIRRAMSERFGDDIIIQ